MRNDLSACCLHVGEIGTDGGGGGGAACTVVDSEELKNRLSPCLDGEAEATVTVFIGSPAQRAKALTCDPCLVSLAA